MEQPLAYAPLHGGAGQSGLQQLTHRDDAVLVTGDPGDLVPR
jgi:hypothetical protein